MKWLWLSLVLLVAGAVTLAAYLFRPLAHEPEPAAFECLDLADGSFVVLEAPGHAYGVGLSYAGHIQETAAEFDPHAAPPIFEKNLRALAADGARVPLPTSDEVLRAADDLEPGLGAQVQQQVGTVSPMLDYEGELGLVLLDDIDPNDLARPDFAPNLGFFVANDLSARSLGLLGEGQTNRYAYWGASKSFPGFMPIPAQAWVPNQTTSMSLPCVDLETTVNGEVRQHQNTRDLIYTPVQMLRFIHTSYPDRALEKGDIILTGTPSGVAVRVPRALVRLANLIGLNRFKKLNAALGRDQSRFLGEGDTVVVRAQALGKVTVTIMP
jgi:2-keto-4-pentenoate hydratase/2-oxohepta-3-ene-1,7-dioic acid hydratase in catechol pathway